MEENKLENIEGIEYLAGRNEKEIETIEIAVKEELKENRKIIIAPPRKQYDIISIGNNSKNIRFIEVKGHIGLTPSTYISLTTYEFNFAKKNSDRYWIYLINIIKDEKEAMILKIKDPINKLKWKKRKRKGRGTEYRSNAYRLLRNNTNESNLKIISLLEERKIRIFPIKEIKIKILKLLEDISNISKEEERILKKLRFIKYREGKITLTHSGIKFFKMIRNQKLKEGNINGNSFK